jgi:hypothetical protein
MPAAPSNAPAPNFATGLNLKPATTPNFATGLNLTPAPGALLRAPTPTATSPVGVLSAESRAKLDGVIQHARNLGYSIEKQKAIVEDFKQKYGDKPTYTPQLTSAGTDINPLNVMKGQMQAKQFATTQIGKIIEASTSAGAQIRSGLSQASRPGEAAGNLPLGLLRTGAGVVNSALSIGAPILGPIMSPIGKAIEAAGNLVSDIPGVQKLAASPVGGYVEAGAEGLLNASTIAGAIAGSKQITPQDVANSEIMGALRSGKTALGDLASSLTNKSEATIESNILTKFEKGVKPLINARTTPGRVAAYREDILTAVKTIKENQPNLTFNDIPGGEAISGTLPKSLQELSDALEQTKGSIFAKYDALAKQTGDAGIKVNVGAIADELSSVINNKALAITNPRAIDYAVSLQERLSNAGGIDAVTAQEVIKNLNKELEAYYRNPTYDMGSRATIDAMVANKMREGLDSAVTSTTGKSYQGLKDQYSALKTIERDVIKASLRDARKNVKGPIDFTDVFSGGQVVNGILSLNPATVAQGVTAKAIASFYKFLNNPNRAIESMFKSVDQLPPPRSLLNNQPAKSIDATPNRNTIPTMVHPVSTASQVAGGL